MNNKNDIEQLFNEVVEAPNGIDRIRRFVLGLAVQGRLSLSDASPEPATELLERISKEKNRLLESGKIKKPKNHKHKSEPPFQAPPNWAWARLGEISSYIQRGKSPVYADGDGVPVISQKCVQWSGLDLSRAKNVTYESLDKYESIRFLKEGDLLWNSTGTGTIGRVVRVDSPSSNLICDSHVTVVRCIFVESEFIRIWLRSDYVYGLIEERAAGSTNQVELTAQLANDQIVPIPPLEEQRRIVDITRDLMTRLDELDRVMREEREVRSRLLDALIHETLNNPSVRHEEAAE
mgnify:CR=1 FL=1